MRSTDSLAVKRVFAEALEQPQVLRDAFVRERCGDTSIRREVVRLLQLRGRIEGGGRPWTPGRLSATDDVEPTPPRAPPELSRGVVLAGRYELGDRLGVGAFGAVYRARDLATGESVAVKALHLTSDVERRWLRREVTVLRRARLPGVVEMLDDWTESGRAFVVMRLVEGRAFPGLDDGPQVPWDVLAPRAVAMLEALGRLHWLGVLHRDIKPENVLVAAAGAVTIVDLGVAREVESFGETAPGYVVGTPTYLAPERLAGAPATPASDIYAAGVMIYEALAGRPPREFRDLDDFVRRRDETPPSIAERVPDLPRYVAAAVDAMVRPSPVWRPRSTRVAVALLAAGTTAAAAPRLPWLGDDASVRAIVDAVRSARCVDVSGTTGCGRSRTLEEAGRRLFDGGFRVVSTAASDEPLGSLAAAIGRALPVGLGGDERVAWLRRVMSAALCARVAVFADDWSEVDPESRALLEELRDHGPVVRVVDGAASGAVSPPPVTEEQLRALFRGPDRFFHLREDGARELFRRTGGVPGAVGREIDAWIELGIARFENGLVVIERSGLDRLEAPFAVSLPRRDVAPGSLPQSALDVAGVLEIAGCPLAPTVIGDVLGAPAARVEDGLASLVDAGLARRTDGGEVAPLASIGASAAWPTERVRAVHAAAARAPSAPPELRVHHLLGADLPEQAARAARELAERELREGRLTLAISALHEAVRALHAVRAPDQAEVDAVGDLILDVALGAGTQDVLRTACWELSRMEPRSPVIDELEGVARAALLAVEGQALRALATLDELGPPESTRLERMRNSVRIFAAPRTFRRDLRLAALRAVAAWARRTDDPQAHPVFSECLAWERYRQGRFLSAARLHARGARRRDTTKTRVAAMIYAAEAALETGEFAWCERLAREAMSLGAGMRHPLHETRIWCVMRGAAYRRGASIEPDVRIVDDLEGRVPPLTAGVAFLNEAAAAWRLGRLQAAGRIAAAAATAFDRAMVPGAAALARALAHVAAGPGVETAPPVVPVAADVSPRLRLQSLALLAPSVDVGLTTADVKALHALSESSIRREVLSDDEIRARLAKFDESTDLEPARREGS